MANPLPFKDQAVTTSHTAVVAPADCRSIRIQQKQGSDPPSVAFHVYDSANSVELSGSPFAGGSNVHISAPAGTYFAKGATVAYIAASAVFTSTYTFTVFAIPMVGSPALMSGDEGSGGSPGVVPAPAAG